MSSVRFYLTAGDDRFALLPGTSTIGRSRNCEVLLTDPAASRNHALVTVDGERVTLQDLSSANGTLVNGHRLEGEIELMATDEVMIGETKLVLERLASADLSTRLLGLEEIAAAAETVPPPRQPSPSEVIPALDVMAGGEILAQPGLYRDRTEPMLTEPVRPVEPPQPPAPPRLVVPPPLPPRPPAETFDPPTAAAFEPPTAAPAVPPTAPQMAPPVVPDGPSGELLPSLEEIERRLAAPAAPTAAGSADRAPGAGKMLAPPAGFWRRVGAMLIDSVSIMLVGFVLSWIGGGPNRAPGLLIYMGVTCLAAVLVPVLGWSRWGTTPGKRLLGLYVCDLDGRVGIPFSRALLRWLGYLLSSLAFGIGYLMPLFTAQKRALHDFVAGTYVARLR